MKDISTLPLETQLVLERFNRAYRRLIIILHRKPLLEELGEELGLNIADTEYYVSLAQDYILVDDININPSETVRYIYREYEYDYDLCSLEKINPATFFIRQLYKNNTSKLTRKEFKLLQLFWGIIDGHAKTYKQVAVILDTKTKKVKKALKEATLKLITE